VVSKRLAYCFGGFDDISNFFIKIAFDSLPAGGYGTQNIYFNSNIAGVSIRNYIAGIDCAGFVHRVWRFNNYNDWKDLCSNSVLVNDSLAKKGDLMNVPSHQILYAGGKIRNKVINSYESTTDLTVSDLPGVLRCYNRIVPDTHFIYSIFPILKSISPENEEVAEVSDTKPLRIECEVEAKKEVQNIRMWLDEEEIDPVVAGQSNVKKIHYMAKDLQEGYHQVSIYAESYTNNNNYCDTLSWYFYYGDTYGKSIKISDQIQEHIPYRGYIFLDKSFNFDFSEYSKMYISGDAYGISEQWVDDSIEVYVTDEYGNTSTMGHNYSKSGEVVPERSMDISDLFSPGRNKIRIVMMDDSIWGVNYGCSEIWLAYIECVGEENKIEPEKKLQNKKLDLINKKSIIIKAFDESDVIESIEIFDIVGRKIYSKNKIMSSECIVEIDGKLELAAGVYFYRVETQKGKITGKILKY